jgi:two-component system response regulator HydG
VSEGKRATAGAADAGEPAPDASAFAEGSEERAVRVLVVDDDDDFRQTCVLTNQSFGYETIGASSADEAMGLLTSRTFDVVLLDILMPDTSGLQALRDIKAEFADVEVVMMSGHASVPWAVDAMRAGATDYLVKPFEAEALKRALSVATRTGGLVRENRRLRRALELDQGPVTLVGCAKPMIELRRLLRKVASSDVSVLLQGESGTGKEVVARAIHWGSARREKPFVPVDCGAIAAGLIESELFGHVRGAFTGADRDREGLIGFADGGTLFLDEIGEMPPEAQVRLLRVLENAEFRPVGATQARHVNVRVIAAANHDLDKKKSFRRDLFFRLNVVTVRVPPLRERREDISLLAEHFLGRHRRAGSTCEGFAADAMATLEAYSWPGNVRQLENVVERCCTLATGLAITRADLPEDVRAPAGGAPGLRTLQEIRKDAIVRTLQAVGNDRGGAAKILGINRSTLYRNMRELGLTAPRAKRTQKP